MAAERKADWLAPAAARDRVLNGVRRLETERRPLLAALGCVLAQEHTSPIDLPLWDNSAMDGFAVRAADVAGASADHPVELPIVDDIAAGSFPAGPLPPRAAARIMTGAPVPAGADSVIRIEHTDGGRDYGGSQPRVRILADVDATRNIRRKGEDLRKGGLVLSAGSVLSAPALGTAASIGLAELEVIRRPVVGIVTSGDELVEVERFEEVRSGSRIVSSNSYTLAAQVLDAGATPRLLGIARDTVMSVREHLERAAGCDVLVTSAGISVGEHDHVHAALLEMEVDVELWRVTMRPGSPFAFGRVGALGGIPWFGLPGNPVSSMVTFELFVRPALLRMAGHPAIFRPIRRARPAEGPGPVPRLTQFLRVRLSYDQEAPVARVTGPQGSGILSSMAAADALLVVPPEEVEPPPDGRYTAIELEGEPLRPEPGW